MTDVVYTVNDDGTIINQDSKVYRESETMLLDDKSFKKFTIYESVEAGLRPIVHIEPLLAGENEDIDSLSQELETSKVIYPESGSIEGGLGYVMPYFNNSISFEKAYNQFPDMQVELLLKLVREVKKLHDKGIVHGDLSWDGNVLVNKNTLGSFDVNIIDFGNSGKEGEMLPESVRNQIIKETSYIKRIVCDMDNIQINVNNGSWRKAWETIRSFDGWWEKSCNGTGTTGRNVRVFCDEDKLYAEKFFLLMRLSKIGFYHKEIINEIININDVKSLYEFKEMYTGLPALGNWPNISTEGAFCPDAPPGVSGPPPNWILDENWINELCHRFQNDVWYLVSKEIRTKYINSDTWSPRADCDELHALDFSKDYYNLITSYLNTAPGEKTRSRSSHRIIK